MLLLGKPTNSGFCHLSEQRSLKVAPVHYVRNPSMGRQEEFDFILKLLLNSYNLYIFFWVMIVQSVTHFGIKTLLKLRILTLTKLHFYESGCKVDCHNSAMSYTNPRPPTRSQTHRGGPHLTLGTCLLFQKKELIFFLLIFPSLKHHESRCFPFNKHHGFFIVCEASMYCSKFELDMLCPNWQ